MQLVIFLLVTTILQQLCIANLAVANQLEYTFTNEDIKTAREWKSVLNDSPTRTTEANVSAETKWDLFSMGTPPHLNCKRLANGDEQAFQEYSSKGRVVLSKYMDLRDLRNVPMDCASVRARIEGNAHDQYPTDTPYAIAVNVFRDYFVIETILGITYSSRNSYCYALDKKSLASFKTKMREMAECFENVQVLEQEYAFDSNGHFQDHAHFGCTQEMLKRGNWEYVLYNQNHDFIIRTNSEISHIIKIINGSQIHGYIEPRADRFDTNRTWTARALHLFKNETSRNEDQLDTPMQVFKTPNHVFLSREFVAALDTELNMNTIMEAFNVQEYYGTDEMLFATLGLANHLGLPGQASPLCTNLVTFMRYVKWCADPLSCCLSKYSIHKICSLTMEYLPELLKHPAIIANKIRADVDFGLLLCIAEELKERSKNHNSNKELNKYTEYFMVRERALRFNGTFVPEKFEC